VPSYAHTHPAFPGDPAKWEPLFTPFSDEADQCQREQCEKCRNLKPYHGHLNKGAFWSPLALPRNHERPSRFASSICSAIRNPLARARSASISRISRSTRAVLSSGGSWLIAKLSSAITSWFKLRRFCFARSLSVACSCSGKFRIVNGGPHSDSKSHSNRPPFSHVPRYQP